MKQVSIRISTHGRPGKIPLYIEIEEDEKVLSVIPTDDGKKVNVIIISEKKVN